MKNALNVQVFEDLVQKIKSGYYELGDKLPTESEMQKIYKVSRAPIRQALGYLQAEGIIERKPGIGSVVINSFSDEPVPSSGGFQWNLNRRWKDLNCKTVSVNKIISDEEDILNSLEIDSTKDDVLIQVLRVRSDNKTPIFLLSNYYNDKDVDIQKIKNAGDISNMRNFIKEELGLKVSYAKEVIKSVAADEETSYYLQVEQGYPLLQIQRTSYDLNYNPIEHVIYHVDSEDWPYMVIYDEIQD